MKEILRVVITGGPCGGKTSALKTLKEMFENDGYTVFIVSETATELINDGIKPFGEDWEKLPTIEFQRLVLKNQLAKERIRDLAAEICNNDKVVILYDRGILDNRAYITHEEFKTLADQEGITEKEILDRYDIVLHMTTAAKGKEEAYTTANNGARIETVEQAREVDDKTLGAWYNHPNRYIFENDCDFDEKLDRVKTVIRRYLKERKNTKVKKLTR